MMHDVIVVGGGIIGMSAARALAAGGRRVLLVDCASPGEAASWAAAGMLAPQSEAETAGPFFHLCAASLRMYRDWTGELREQSGVDPEYSDAGILCLAASESALQRLERRCAWQREAGFSCEMATPEDARRLEPQLTLPLAGALFMPEERQVTPRRLLRALLAACVAGGVAVRSGARVQEVVVRNGSVAGVRIGGGGIERSERIELSERIDAPYVVITAGTWSAEIAGIAPAIPVYPRKGQILSLAGSGRTFQRTIRAEHAYLVPRPDGELVVGATDEDAGFDRSLTPAGVGRLLQEAQRIAACTASLPIREFWTGLRPATRDGLPIIGRAAVDGLIYATGHYRNGILLAPVTASIVADLVERRTPSLPLDAFSPFRFS